MEHLTIDEFFNGAFSLGSLLGSRRDDRFYYPNICFNTCWPEFDRLTEKSCHKSVMCVQVTSPGRRSQSVVVIGWKDVVEMFGFSWGSGDEAQRTEIKWLAVTHLHQILRNDYYPLAKII